MGVIAGVLTLPGCFSEQSYPMVESRLVRMEARDAREKLSAREWAVEANRAAAEKLPPDDRQVLTGEDLDRNGRVVNVWERYGINPSLLDNVWTNFSGLQETARVASPSAEPDGTNHLMRDRWAGFHDVQVPVGDGVTLYGRLGAPEKSREIPGSYIVFTPGLFGTLDGLDTQNQVEALRRAGHHVLAIEMRGHGETACEHPEYTVSFGIHETSDFLAIANWLRKTQGATRVGLVSFSLTGYEALLTAWLDGEDGVHRFASIPLLKDLPCRQTASGGEEPSAFNAGMFIVSPPVDVVAVADAFDTSYDLLEAPCKATFEGHVRERMKDARPEETPTGNMWQWVSSEFRRAGWLKTYPDFAAIKHDLLKFIDLHGKDWSEGVRRMANVRTPVLVLSAANDPLGTAQSVAELFGRVRNPNIGVLILREGGHAGFTAVSADYYYSLMVNFFDPRRGPGAKDAGELAKSQLKGAVKLNHQDTRREAGFAGEFTGENGADAFP